MSNPVLNERALKAAGGWAAPQPGTAATGEYYLPVDDDDMQWGIYVTGAGRGLIRAGEPYPPADHPPLYQMQWRSGRSLPEFQVILISDGRGAFESQTSGRLPVAPGSVILLFPDVWHRYRPDPQTGWSERWISLSGRLMHGLMERGLIDPRFPVRAVGDVASMAAAFDELLDRIDADPLQNSILLALAAMSVLGKAIDSAADGKPAGRRQNSSRRADVVDPLAAAALERIWTRSHRPLSVAQIAKPLRVSRRTLERRFQAAVGRGVLAEIAACRLARAKRLLRETNLPIKAIARLAGFSSRERMRAAFQSAERLSPGRFRRKKTEVL